MKAAQIASGPAPTQASARPQSPSATRPSIGAALRLISAKSRTIAAEWVGMASGPVRAIRARRSSMVILRRRAAASGSLPSAGPALRPQLAHDRPTRTATRCDYAVQMINERLTAGARDKHFRRGIRVNGAFLQARSNEPRRAPPLQRRIGGSRQGVATRADPAAGAQNSDNGRASHRHRRLCNAG